MYPGVGTLSAAYLRTAEINLQLDLLKPFHFRK